jgi:hypothetical protein
LKDKGNFDGIHGLSRIAGIMARTYGEGQFRQQIAGKASWPPAGREIACFGRGDDSLGGPGNAAPFPAR